MKKVRDKLRRSKLLSAAIILCVTAAYLLVTASFAQKSEYDSTLTGMKYVPDQLSYGDIWAFDKATYDQSKYVGQSQMITYYTEDGEGKTATLSAGYYGALTWNRQNFYEAPTRTLVSKREYGAFNSSPGYAEIEGVNQEMIPVLTTTGVGTYTVIPHSSTSGDFSYRIYVYSESNPTNKVKYHRIDSWSDNNTYAGYSDATKAFEGATAPSFKGVGNNWWYATVSIPNIAWEAALLTGAGTSASGADGKADNDYTGQSLSRTELDSTTHYFNQWKYTTVKFNTLLVLQWDSSVKLGPVTKEDTITISNDSDTSDTYTGTIKATNIFGESIVVDGSAQTAPHAPIFLSVDTVGEGSVFGGFTGAEVDPPVNSLYRAPFESALTIAGNWRMLDPLPSVTVSSNGSGTGGSSDFYAVPSIAARYTAGTAQTYTITPNFDNAYGATITYKISEPGVADRTGLLTEVITIPVEWDTVTVVLTATSANGETVETCTITIKAVADSSLTVVAQNLTTEAKYRFIEDAIMDAVSGDTIVMLANATFRTAEQGQKKAWLADNAGYTIDTGVKFLIPCSASDTGAFGSMPKETYASTASPSTFRTLTVPEGVRIICNGELNVNGHRRESGQGASGTGAPRGAHGKLVLQGSGTQLTINGALSCYGFITGTGTVEVSKTGATYELMQIYDWPGGTNFAGKLGSGGWMAATKSDKSNALFFCSRYFIQNIEAPLIAHSGCTMNMEAALTAGGETVASSGKLIGSDGLFRLGEGTYITRVYDPKTDRLIYASGGAGQITIGSITIGAEILSIRKEVTSSDYILPLNGAMTICVGNGTTVNLQHNFAIMPGCEIIVEQGGALNISGNLFVFDLADMTAAMSYQTQIAPLYTAGRGSTVALNIQSSGRLEVNGTVEVASTGGIYTTTAAGGVNSTNTDKKIYGFGKIIYNGATTSKTIKAGYSDALINITASSALGLIEGSSANEADLKTFGKNTYYGTGELGKHYWYVPSLPVHSTVAREDDGFTIDAEYRLQDYLWLNAICYLGEATNKIDLSAGSVNVYTMKPDGSAYVNNYANGVFTQNEGVQILAIDGAIYLIKKIPSDEIPDDITFRIEYTDANGTLYRSAQITVCLEDCKTSDESDTTTNPLVDALLEYGAAAKKYFVTGGVPDSVLTYDNTFTSTVTGNKKHEASAENVYVADNKYDNKTLKISGMNFLFEERLALMVAMKFSASVDKTWIENNVSQMGILVCDKGVDSEVSEIVLTVGNYSEYGRAVILYGAAKNANSSNIPTLPDYEDYTYTGKKTLTAEQVATSLSTNGYVTAYMDLLSSQYTSSFKIRPFVIMKDGSVLYAPQYEYGLGAYIKTMLAKNDDSLQASIGQSKNVDAFRNLLVTTWDYAKKAVAYCEAHNANSN